MVGESTLKITLDWNCWNVKTASVCVCVYMHWTGSECVHTVARNVYMCVSVCVKQDRSEMEGQLTRR